MIERLLTLQKIAEEWTKDLETEIDRMVRGETWTLEESKEKVFDLGHYSKSYMENLEIYWGRIYEMWSKKKPLTSVGKSEILSWVSELKSRGIRNSTIRHHVYALSKAFDVAVGYGVLDSNPVSQIDMKRLLPDDTQTRDRRLSEEEFQRIYQHALFPHTKIYLLLAWATGARHSEIVSLEIEDLDIENGRVHFRNDPEKDKWTKNRRDRTIAVDPDVLKAVREMAPVKNGWLFRHPRTGRRMRDVADSVRKSAERAGLNGVTTHVIRHSVGSLLHSRGVSLTAIRDHLGHSDFRMTSRYSHSSDADMESAAQNLARTLKATESRQNATPNATPSARTVEDLIMSEEFVSLMNRLCYVVERETGFEPATLSLGS